MGGDELTLTEKIRIAVRYLIDRDALTDGDQTRLAEYFKTSRQRVHQAVVLEKNSGKNVVIHPNPKKEIKPKKEFRKGPKRVPRIELKGESLRQLRLKYNLTQEAFGNLLEVPQPIVSEWEGSCQMSWQARTARKRLRSVHAVNPNLARELAVLLFPRIESSVEPVT